MRIIITLFFFIPYTLSSQVAFDYTVINENDDCQGRYDLDTGDIDGDGYLDIVTALFCNQGSGEFIISWFRNSGNDDGSFGEEIGIEMESANSYSVSLSDLDGDGRLDVVAAIDNEVVWYKNTDGLGGFSAKQVIYAESGIRDVLAEDIDNDGNIDLFFSNQSSSTDNIIGLMKGSGNAIFSTPQFFVHPFNMPFRLKTADLNGNGYPDLVVSGLFKIAWYENNLGMFSGEQLVISDEVVGVISFDTGDFDQDGDQDLLVPSIETGTAIYLFENIDNSFDSAPTNIADLDFGNPKDVIFLDVDDDGDEDIAAAIGEHLYYYENIDGGFQAGAKISDDDESYPYRLVSSDLNNDTKQDLAACTLTGKKVVTYLNRSMGTSSTSTPVANRIYPTVTNSMINIDFESAFDNVYVIDLNGKVVSYHSSPSQLDLTGLSSGLYHLLFIKDQKIVDKLKVVKK